MHFMSRTLPLLFWLILAGFALPVSSQVNWMTWEEAQARQEKEPRKFLVDVYTQWCGWCKKMDKTTFDHPDIAKYIHQHYYAVKFDAETKSDIPFKDHIYKYVRSGSTGYHELAAELTFGKLSFPTLVFLDESLNVIQPIPGFKDPQSLDKIIKYFGEDYYKTTPWKKYEQMYIMQHLNPPVPPTPVKSNQD